MSKALRIASGSFGRVALLDMDRCLVRHAHPHCHVLLKIDGDDTRFVVGDRVALLTDTVAVLVNAWEPHAYIHDPARRSALILALYIEPLWLEQFRSNWRASSAPGFFTHTNGDVTGIIARLAQALALEMVHDAETSTRQEELLSQLMIAVIEQFSPWTTVGTALRHMTRASSQDRRIRRAIEAIRADPGAAPGVDRMAQAAGVSRAHFFRLFEGSTGVTPHLFLNSIRVERALALVASGDQSLTEIGIRLGFGSPAHFSRFFRDHVSVAPSAFRSRVRHYDGPGR